MAVDKKIRARLKVYFKAEADAVDSTLITLYGTFPDWIPKPSIDRARRLVQSLLNDGFSAKSIGLRVSEAISGELLFPGTVRDAAAFAQTIYELAHLRYAISLGPDKGLGVLAGEQAARGQKFSPGKKAVASGPVRKLVARLLKANPRAKNHELWEAVRDRPPKGWEAIENPRFGKYLECPPKNMGYRRFCNVCAEERRILKGKITG